MKETILAIPLKARLYTADHCLCAKRKESFIFATELSFLLRRHTKEFCLYYYCCHCFSDFKGVERTGVSCTECLKQLEFKKVKDFSNVLSQKKNQRHEATSWKACLLHVMWLVAPLCPTHCNLMDCSPPGSSVRGISQARIRKWVVISFSRGSSLLRD